jgi:hypothetical protein
MAPVSVAMRGGGAGVRRHGFKENSIMFVAGGDPEGGWTARFAGASH